MAKHTETSWKPDKPLNQLHNSVDKATNAVEQAASHPSPQLIQQAQHALDRAENGVINTLQSEENNQEAIQQLQAQLNQDQQLLQQLQSIEDER